MKEEKQRINKDGKYVEVTYLYDEKEGGHPLQTTFRDLTLEEIEEEKIKEQGFKDRANNLISLKEISDKLDIILEKLNA